MHKNIEIGVTSLQCAINCPLCFWLSEKVASPPSIVAGITSQIDSVIKKYMEKFVGSSQLPSWFPIGGTLLKTSRILKARDPSSGVILRGKLDALVKTRDGKYVIVDYKTGKPPKEIPNYYQIQLDGYAFILEQNGLKPVSGGILLYFTPEEGEISEKSFPFKITGLHAKVDPNRVPPILEHIKKILEMDYPPERSEGCEMCIWREQIEKALSK